MDKIENKHFRKSVFKIALPVMLQTLLQSSFSVIDQIMIGQLGSGSIAGIGLGGKFASIYSVVLGAIASAAGILLAQYIDRKNSGEFDRSLQLNLLSALLAAALFTAVCCLAPDKVMSVYTKDSAAQELGVEYLRIYALSFVPVAFSTLAAVVLRCMEEAVFPLIAGFAAVALNTGLNWLLIFGRWGFPRMGVRGAALASVIAQGVCCVLTLIFLGAQLKKRELKLLQPRGFEKKGVLLFLNILFPILVCEFLWSLGENVYAAIYGNLGTGDCAAMTITYPVQGLIIGALSGLSQAAGVIVGKALGAGEKEDAYEESRKLMKYGLLGSLLLSVLLVLSAGLYLQVYNVEETVRRTAFWILVAFAVISPVKVQNMILGGGIIRSGGDTKYVMWIDIIGTWLFGVPLGLLAAFVWKLSIPWVYFILSLEECVRLAISLAIFRGKSWMKCL